jgi:hypothetical protein
MSEKLACMGHCGFELSQIDLPLFIDGVHSRQ